MTLSSPTRKPVEVVKVADLPDIADFQRADGSYVDLGWRYLGETDGEWVGYIGSSTGYLTVSPAQLTEIIRIAGLETLPEPPTRLGFGASAKDDVVFNSGGRTVLWPYAVLAAALALLALRTATRRTATGARTPPAGFFSRA